MSDDHPNPRPGRPVGRPPSERNAAERRLRGMIVRGRFKPGERIPPLLELASRLRVSAGTAQAVLASMARDGFLETRGARGTFVVDHPPHLCRYGVVSPYDGPSPWGPHSRFFRVLEAAAADLQGRDAWRSMVFYRGIDHHVDVEDYHAAVAAIRGQRLAGLIFLNSPHELAGLPLLEEPGLPRVAVMAGRSFDHVPAVYVDLLAWLDRALERLAARGLRRPALVGLPGGNFFNAVFAQRAAHHGMTHRPYWMQNVAYASPDEVSRCVQLLFHPGQDLRPDCLLITDDHLADGATRGLLAAGLASPAELEVISLANFPSPPAVHRPVTFLGFDAAQIIARCVESIDLQRRGEAVPGLTLLPPLFESEFASLPQAVQPAAGAARG